MYLPAGGLMLTEFFDILGMQKGSPACWIWGCYLSSLKEERPSMLPT